MFRSLFRNIAISAFAYAAVSAVSLVLAPVLIARYGLAGFGQIVIARLFIPNAAFGILDFGTGEIATQVVSRSRRDGEWTATAQTLTLLGIMALATGILAGTVLAAISGMLPGWMSVAPDLRPGLTDVLRVTAVLLPLFFLSLLFEGVLKGFEDFRAQRGCEVLAAVSYGGLTLAAVWRGMSLNAVCYALLISLIIRLAFATVVAIRLLRPWQMRPGRWTGEVRDFVWRWARIMAANKFLGALQTQAAPPLIGLMFGPAAVGAVDALSRLPRFVKSILGLLNSTVLPLAAKLEFGSDTSGLRRLGETGMMIVAIVAIPGLAAAMTFSEPITRLWLGKELAVHWYWQSLLFIVPLTNTLVSFGGAILLVRDRATSAMNRIVFAQVALQLLLSVLLSLWLQQWAFILGQVIAVSITFILQMRLISRELGFRGELRASLLRLSGLCLALGITAVVFAQDIPNLPVLAVCMGGWLLVCWGLCWPLVIDAPRRQQLAGLLRSRWVKGEA